MDVFSVTSDSLFTPATSDYSSQMQTMSLRALNKGLTQFTAGRYDQAIATFNQAIRFAPTADSALSAYDYMARSYLTQGNTQAAIDAYTKALKVAPSRDDLHVQLGNIYTTTGDTDKALAQYQLAVKYNASAANLYSLGQGYLGTGQTDQAMVQFQQVKQLQPHQPYGDFGIGQTYAKEKNYQDAINAFQTAISKQTNYLNAYSELGYAYADSGQISQANDVVSTLNTLSPGDATLANSLNQYIYEKSKPKIVQANASNVYTPFLPVLGPGTPVNAMNFYTLSQANATQTVSMVFQFSKPMDQASVENVFNWNISRATGSGRGDGYDYNMTPPATDVTLQPTPLGVYYDPTTQSATVLFNITQNATADGTIDPSHINFSFSGKDVTGLSMDPSANMYSGFTGVA
jgi:tetratricopeptide (TPR) repeat protein